MGKYTISEIVAFSEKLKADMASEDYDYHMTKTLKDAIYILYNGELISGDFDYGVRSTDHRMIECTMEIDRYTPGFWDEVHERFSLVRLVPESGYALIKQGQQLSKAQKLILARTNYILEEY